MSEYQISKNTIEFNLSRLQYALLAGSLFPFGTDKDVRTAEGFMKTIGRILDFQGAPGSYYFTIQVLRSEMDAILGLDGVKVLQSNNTPSPSYYIEHGVHQYSFQVLFDTKYPVSIWYKDEEDKKQEEFMKSNKNKF